MFSQPPRIDEDTGLLILQGYCATRPAVTHFTIKHLYEHPSWKLAAIGVNLEAPEGEIVEP